MYKRTPISKTLDLYSGSTYILTGAIHTYPAHFLLKNYNALGSQPFLLGSDWLKKYPLKLINDMHLPEVFIFSSKVDRTPASF